MKIDLMKIITYDFSNLNLHEHGSENCFNCDCNCDCDSDDCDCNTYCDNCD